jgi:N6-adenosine-specific RNA methylase IME4
LAGQLLNVSEHSNNAVVRTWQYDLIEEYFSSLPKIELNARRARPGWDSWGLDAPQRDACDTHTPPHDPETGAIAEAAE